MILCLNQIYIQSSPSLITQHNHIFPSTTIPLYSSSSQCILNSSSSSSSSSFSYYISLFQTKNILSFYQQANNAQLRVLNRLWDSHSLYSPFLSSPSSSSTSSSFSFPSASSSFSTNEKVHNCDLLSSTTGPVTTSSSLYDCIFTHLFPILLNEQPKQPQQQQQKQQQQQQQQRQQQQQQQQQPEQQQQQQQQHSTGSFPYGVKAKVVPIIADRVSLPTSSLNTVDMLSMLPDNLKSIYSEPEKILLTQEQYTSRLLLTKKLSKPTVNGDRQEYINLMQKMIKLNMIGTTKTPKAVNSIFTVEKDKDSDRLIIDAQSANRFFIDSPHVKLPTPSNLASLSIPNGYTIMTAKTDLSNFYHHIHIPQYISEYLALPACTMKELGLSDSNELVYPICLTLPMGWSHSVFIAQSIHEYVLYKYNHLNKYHNIISITTPDITEYPIHCLYIDDLVLLYAVPIGTTTSVMFDLLFHRILLCYSAAGLVVKQSKVVYPSVNPITVLGVYIYGTIITVENEKIRQLVSDTIVCLQSITVTGHRLSQIIGSWCWIMLLNRPLLSILKYVYRYIQIADRREFTLWNCVKKELVMLIGLSSLLHVDLCYTIHDHMIATDASEQGAGVVSTYLTNTMYNRMWPIYYNQSQSLECETERWAIPHRIPLNGKKIEKRKQKYNTGLFSNNYLMIQPSIHKLIKWNNPISFEKILKKQCIWSYIINYQWKYKKQNIAQLEASSLLLSLQHLSSLSHSCINHRVFTLLDSSVLYYAVRKGRSSSPSLSYLVSSISSICLVTGIRLFPFWIPSEWNPADLPSRVF